MPRWIRHVGESYCGARANPADGFDSSCLHPSGDLGIRKAETLRRLAFYIGRPAVSGGKSGRRRIPVRGLGAACGRPRAQVQVVVEDRAGWARIPAIARSDCRLFAHVPRSPMHFGTDRDRFWNTTGARPAGTLSPEEARSGMDG